MSGEGEGEKGGGGVPACGWDMPSIPPEYDAILAITIYVFPVFLLIGSIGNVLSAILMHKLSAQVWSTCLYLSVLAVVELLVLYVECGNRWYAGVAEDLSGRIMSSSNALCKVYLFLYQFIRDLAPWIIVSVAVETLVATRWPLRMYAMCTRERARAVLLFITVLLVCLAMQYFWTYGLYQIVDPSMPYPTISCSYIEEFSDKFRDQVWPYLSLAVGHVVPLIGVAGLLGVTLLSYKKDDLYRLRAQRSRLAKYFLDLEALGELRIATTLVSLFYVVVGSLRIVTMVVKYLIDYKVIVIPFCSSASIRAKIRLGSVLNDALFYIFLSSKIFIYLATCRRFRRNLVELFRSCKNCRGHPVHSALRCPVCCRPRGSSVSHADPPPAAAMLYSQDDGDPDPLGLPQPKAPPRLCMNPRPGLPVTEEGIRAARRGLGQPKTRSSQGKASLDESRGKVFPDDPFARKSRAQEPVDGMEAAGGVEDGVPEAFTSLDEVAMETDPLSPYKYEFVANEPDARLGVRADAGKVVVNASCRSPKRQASCGSDSKSLGDVNPGVNTDV